MACGSQWADPRALAGFGRWGTARRVRGYAGTKTRVATLVRADVNGLADVALEAGAAALGIRGLEARGDRGRETDAAEEERREIQVRLALFARRANPGALRNRSPAARCRRRAQTAACLAAGEGLLHAFLVTRASCVGAQAIAACRCLARQDLFLTVLPIAGGRAACRRRSKPGKNQETNRRA